MKDIEFDYKKIIVSQINRSLVIFHYGNGAPITVYYLGHLFPNYNVLMGNFDNYSSNLIVSDD